MIEIITDFFTVFHAGQLLVSLRIAPPACDTAEKKQLIIKLNITFNKPDIRQVENCLINPDIAFAVEVRFGSRLLHNDLCSTVQL